ncbi:MAG: putative selenate reductase subunit YgfK, partial [Treponema sp.]|nr:putative selenate reductase subunit YgfK [Treponema sp.]
MSGIMRPIPFPELVGWVRGEYKKHRSVFGVRKEKFYRPGCGGSGPAGGFEFFGKRISSPIGPAAGPNSQLAQNILAAYLAGARFVELKTVQTIDGEELRKAVARPCINAEDEGYNVEWSTELTVSGAFEEYVKAWFLCHVFGREFGITQAASDAARPGDFIFNMSVGYSLEGIKSEKIDTYIRGMKDACGTEAWKRCYQYIADTIGSFEYFTMDDLNAVSPEISGGITLSTLHGCPREEIEKIAVYLVCEKGLHTYIKCNPTLLGYETARRLLDEMGYGYISFDDRHFKNDLQFADAVEMIGRLKALAGERHLSFGVKLTNTFPVQIMRNELPGNEMYMSGRSLFPLSINAAKKLSGAFDGDLSISYSGGADFFNLKEILATGIAPVTVATAILKPGGYERLVQLAESAEKSACVARPGIVDMKALSALAGAAAKMERYRKEYRKTGSRKSSGDLPLFDCARAPCADGGCPIHQSIPDYLAAVAEGDYGRAFRIIAVDNTAPAITGAICDHRCQNKCTRVDYEDPLEIRRAKFAAAFHAEKAYTASLKPPPLKTGKRTAVIGAGPAGIAAAVFLRRNGVPVTVYERRPGPYGIVRYVIPAFRISDGEISRDFQIAEKTGVEFVFNAPEDYSVEELKKKNDFVVIATGAWKEGACPVKRGGERIVDALKFLENSRASGCGLSLGKRVAVIGGGDVALDCARAAKRNRGVESASIVYRRTREFMPAQYGEQELAVKDGIKILELLAPESFSAGILTCEKMFLAGYDQSGRRGIAGTGEKLDLAFDTVISAVGARVDTSLFEKNGVALDSKGFPMVDASCESSVPGVYIAGDCRAGASVVVRAIADGKAAAGSILGKLGLSADFSAAPRGPACVSGGGSAAEDPSVFPNLYGKKGIIMEAKDDDADGFRCLSCNVLCEICADVCPNRANVVVELPVPKAGRIGGMRQIVHMDRMCNECGNCATFCPHAGSPFRDKFTVFCTHEDFMDSGNPGFLKTGPDTFTVRLEEDRKS